LYPPFENSTTRIAILWMFPYAQPPQAKILVLKDPFQFSTLQRGLYTAGINVWGPLFQDFEGTITSAEVNDI
jgi:hypothetical protein